MISESPILCDMCRNRWNKDLPLKVEVKFVYNSLRHSIDGYCIHKFGEIELTNLNLDYVEQEAIRRGLI